MTKSSRFILLLSLITLIHGVTPCPAKAEEESPDQTTITVTFDDMAPVAAHGASGFLSLINANTPDPPSNMIKVLKPRLWKNAYHTNYWRIHNSNTGFGCPSVLTTLAEHWGLPAHSPPPWLDDLNPDWSTWKSFCAYHVKVHLDQGFNPVWNIWNEPDGKSRWWHGPIGYTNLAMTYMHAYKAIRQAYVDHPNFDIEDMVVAAPGFADWGNAYGYHSGKDYWSGDLFEVGFEGFLAFCIENRVECHVIMWHEFWEDLVFYIPAKAEIMKNLVAGHMAVHPEINVQRYYVDEMIHADYPYSMNYHLSPGHVAAVLSLLEIAGIDGACRACWKDKHGFSGNINFSVDSILDVIYFENPPGNPVLSPPPSASGHPRPYTPRSHYWVHWYYAQFEGPVATVEASYPPQSGFGTYDPVIETYQVMLGYSLSYGYSNGIPTYGYGTTRTEVVFEGLPVFSNLLGQARITLTEIVPSGWNPVEEPLVVVDHKKVTYEDGRLTWTLEEMKRGHAYVIEITEIEPGPPAPHSTKANKVRGILGP